MGQITLQDFNAEEEAYCRLIDYCNCSVCSIAGRCQLCRQNMCKKGLVFLDGFMAAVELIKEERSE